MKHIVHGDKLYSELPDVLKFNGCVETVKSRVLRIAIYDEPPFMGLSPTEISQIFKVIYLTIFYTINCLKIGETHDTCKGF